MKHSAISILILMSFLMPVQAFAAKAAAVISGTAEGSTVTGTVTFEDAESGLRVQVQIAGLPPGLHGIHIHEKGSCKDGGNAAGSHYNPDNVKHGFLQTDGLTGAHAGDLGNIQINDNGQGAVFLIIPGLTVNGKEHSVAGKAVILHEKKDDFGQPTGNAGGRIGCGVIEAVDESFVPSPLPTVPTEVTPAAETTPEQAAPEQTEMTQAPTEAPQVTAPPSAPQETPKKKKWGWW